MLPKFTKEQRQRLGFLVRRGTAYQGLDAESCAQELNKRLENLTGVKGQATLYDIRKMMVDGVGISFLPVLVLLQEMGVLPKEYEELRRWVDEAVDAAKQGTYPDYGDYERGKKLRELKPRPKGTSQGG